MSYESAWLFYHTLVYTNLMETKGILRVGVRLSYILFLLIPLYVIYKNTGGIEGLLKSFTNPSLAAYLFLRLTGLYAFFLIFLQIVHGAFMPLWFKIFDSRSAVLHEKHGVWAYLLILSHPIFFTLSAVLASGFKEGIITLFPAFQTKTDILINYGRIGFTLITIAVFASYFRHKGFLNRHWLKFHILNYVAFYFIFLHSWNIGSDTRTFPLSVLYPAMAIVVAFSIAYRILPRVWKALNTKPTKKLQPNKE